MSPWRNWLARSTVNRKVDGSIPSGDVYLDPINIIEFIRVKHAYSLLYNRCRCSMSPWRNWLARSAVNRKVDGSIPSGDVF